MECEFCNKKLSSISALNHHKQTAKYCIEIQGKNINDLKNTCKCEYCNKIFTTNYKLNAHILTCKKTNINNFEEENKYLLEENINLKKLVIEKDLIISKLKAENSIYQKDHESLIDIAKQTKNNITTNNINNTTKILNIKSFLDLDNINKVKELIDDKYDLEYIFDGQKGIAKFAIENILTDENGNLKYICTDPSRYIFKYKDPSGDIQKDIEAKKLTNFLLEGGINNKVSNLAIKWWTKNNGEIDNKKVDILLEKAESMNELKDDNNIFKKELVSMTI
jgi:hypothetical protein